MGLLKTTERAQVINDRILVNSASAVLNDKWVIFGITEWGENTHVARVSRQMWESFSLVGNDQS